MGRVGRTKAPCPGCHRRARTYHDPDDPKRFYAGDRPADGLCRDCETALAEAQQIVARTERAAARQKALQPYKVPEMPHWMPYVPHGRHAFAAGEEPGPALQRLLCALVDAVSTPAVVDAERKWSDVVPLFTRPSSNSGIGNKTPVLLAPDVAALLNDVEQAIVRYGECAYTEGFHAGRNLLAALANGDLTVSELDDRAARDVAERVASTHIALRKQQRSVR